MKKIVFYLILICLLHGCVNKADEEPLIQKTATYEDEIVELQEKIDALSLLNENLKIENDLRLNKIDDLQQVNDDLRDKIENYSDVIDKLLMTPENYIIDLENINFILGFLPKGWLISTFSNGSISIAKGELNHDEFDDIAVIIEENSSGERKLLLFLGNLNEAYHLEYICENAILNLYEGGGFGNPLWDLNIDNHELNLNFYGGGFGRFFMDYKFVFIDDDLKLINAKTGFHVPTENGVFVEYIEDDYLLKIRTEEYLKDKKMVTETSDIIIHELTTISDFEPLMMQFEE